jgi:hypothetical protein
LGKLNPGFRSPVLRLEEAAAKDTYPLPTNGGVCNDMAIPQPVDLSRRDTAA